MNCKICNCEVGIIKTIQPFFRHLDFATIAKKINLIKCFKCQSIINPFLENQELFSFTTKEYANSHQTKQTMYVDKSIKPVTRSSLQAKILHEKLIINEKNNILDFGCFDGHLLIELDKILNNCEFWGYDINPHLQSLFPKKDNFHFILKNLRNLEVKFDLIILSHSVIYVPDFTELMVSIDQLLKQDGTLFIQIPDISINPFYSLMGDQTVIFTKVSLTNALANFGYELVSINNDYFPREALFFAQKNENILDKYNYSMDYTFEKNLKIINLTKKKLKKINYENITVLGTTVNAAFADEILGERMQFFIDENPSKIGKIFRSKKVIHPNKLSTRNHTLIPFGESGADIKNRFNKLYDGTFATI